MSEVVELHDRFESSIYVAGGHRDHGIGKALVRQQVIAADEAGLWTLQTAIFTENRAGIALHHQAGYRTVGIRERIAQRDGTWHDTRPRRTPRRLRRPPRLPTKAPTNICVRWLDMRSIVDA